MPFCLTLYRAEYGKNFLRFFGEHWTLHIWRFGVTSAKSIGHYLSIKFNSVLQDLKKSFQPTFVKTSHAIEFENGS